MAQTDGAPRRLADRRERFRQKLLKNLRLFFTYLLIELFALGFDLFASLRFCARALGARFFKLFFQTCGGFGKTCFELVGSSLELGIAEALIARLGFIDLLNVRANPLDFAVVLGADDSFYPIHNTTNFLSAYLGTCGDKRIS